MNAGSASLSLFDLDEDEIVSENDVTFLVGNILQTNAGDTNLDETVGFSDFVTIANRIGHEASS